MGKRKKNQGIEHRQKWYNIYIKGATKKFGMDWIIYTPRKYILSNRMPGFTY